MNSKYDLTIKNAWLCQIHQRTIEPIFGELRLRDGKIQAIMPLDFQNFVQQQVTAEDEGYDVRGRVVTVPLINFHDHLYSRLAKGLPIQVSIDVFYDKLRHLWWQVDRALDLELIEASATIGALDSLRQGVTYIFDHHASPLAAQGSLRAIKQVLVQHGLRAVLAFETSDRNGPAVAHQALDEFADFYEHEVTNDAKAMLGLHASFTLEDDTLIRASELLKTYDTGIHIHLCEDPIDRSKSAERYHDLPVHRLKKFHLLNAKSILAHGIHLTAADYATIAEAGSAIAYNLDSNLNNAVGLPTFNRAPEPIPILVGTDGMHANISRSLKQLFLLYRHQGNGVDDSFRWFQKCFFDQLDFVHHYFADFPTLNPGDRADLIIWDYIPPAPICAENFWGHFIYGMLEAPIHSVIQAGRFLMKDKLIHGEEAARIASYKQGARLFDRFCKGI